MIISKNICIFIIQEVMALRNSALKKSAKKPGYQEVIRGEFLISESKPPDFHVLFTLH